MAKHHKKHSKELLGNTEMQHKHHLVWIRDFNRHHPCWDSMDNSSLFTKEAIKKSELLIQTIAKVGLDITLLVGIPTHKHSITKRWSRLDQVFVTEHRAHPRDDNTV